MRGSLEAIQRTTTTYNAQRDDTQKQRSTYTTDIHTEYDTHIYIQHIYNTHDIIFPRRPSTLVFALD